jgi:hypothetical protein
MIDLLINFFIQWMDNTLYFFYGFISVILDHTG